MDDERVMRNLAVFYFHLTSHCQAFGGRGDLIALICGAATTTSAACHLKERALTAHELTWPRSRTALWRTSSRLRRGCCYGRLLRPRRSFRPRVLCDRTLLFSQHAAILMRRHAWLERAHGLRSGTVGSSSAVPAMAASYQCTLISVTGAVRRLPELREMRLLPTTAYDYAPAEPQIGRDVRGDSQLYKPTHSSTDGSYGMMCSL
jgi:hypothetical protein